MEVPNKLAPAHPVRPADALRWLQRNLFNTWYNSLLSLLALLVMLQAGRALLTWVLFDADWTVFTANLRLLMVGTFPVDQLWRVWLCVVLASALLGLSRGIWPAIVGMVGPVYGSVLALLALAPLPLGLDSRLWLGLCAGLIGGGWLIGHRFARGPAASKWGQWVGGGWVLLAPLVLVLLYGIEPLLPVVTTRQWGGLLLTFILAISGILFSFPLGVLLAIGRRSSLRAISIFCTVYIEVFRGVPLVTVLFMFLIMLPFFIPGGESTDNIVRAIVGYTLFTAAYIAENVRGGLQSIPRGQFEAAKALGLNPVLTLGFIILPQALRVVIPANVNQFVSLFKDTSLVIIAGGGMLELLGISSSIAEQGAFLGRWRETLVFAGIVYWVFCFSLTYVSRRLEASLQGGQR